MTDRLRRAWAWWDSYARRTTDPRVLAMLRIGVPLCIVADLARGGQLGLLGWMYTPYTLGGINATVGRPYRLDWLFPDQQAGLIGVGFAVTLLGLGALGVFHRLGFVLGAWFYAQLGCLYTAGDRGIDRLLRTVLLVLAFSEAHRAWGLARREVKVPAWPVDLLRLLLVVVYVSAGIAKVQSSQPWITSETPALYYIFADPMGSWLDPVALQVWMPVLRVLSAATLVVELSAPLILTRYAPWWALCAMWIHIGIAGVMKLGMFSFGMLALYPVLFEAWIVAGLARVDRYQS